MEEKEQGEGIATCEGWWGGLATKCPATMMSAGFPERQPSASGRGSRGDHIRSATGLDREWLDENGKKLGFGARAEGECGVQVGEVDGPDSRKTWWLLTGLKWNGDFTPSPTTLQRPLILVYPRNIQKKQAAMSQVKASVLHGAKDLRIVRRRCRHT